MEILFAVQKISNQFGLYYYHIFLYSTGREQKRGERREERGEEKDKRAEQMREKRKREEKKAVYITREIPSQFGLYY